MHHPVQPLLGALLALSKVRLHNHSSVSKKGPHSEIGSRRCGGGRVQAVSICSNNPRSRKLTRVLQNYVNLYHEKFFQRLSTITPGQGPRFQPGTTQPRARAQQTGRAHVLEPNTLSQALNLLRSLCIIPHLGL